jgi:hypothetical protein
MELVARLLGRRGHRHGSGLAIAHFLAAKLGLAPLQATGSNADLKFPLTGSASISERGFGLEQTVYRN